MRICIDIDGTICELKTLIGSYGNVLPLPGARDFIKSMRKKGHTIILYTARHMKTCDGNVGLVLARQGLTLFNWLEEHDIQYDEIYFGKPSADVYIDDNAFRFNGNWMSLMKEESLEKIKSTENNFSMNIVVTMAGAGSRFRKAGYSLPKPLIPIYGMPMYRYSTNSLPLDYAEKLIFIIQNNEYASIIEKDIRNNYSDFDFEIVKIDHLTRGQSESLYHSFSTLKHNIPTLVHNSDSAIVYQKKNLLSVLKKADGVLFTFEADNPRYSYAKIDAQGNVLEVREKVVISSHASTGTYYFKSTVQMLNLIEASIKNNELENGEFFIAPLYNKMIKAGQIIRTFPTSDYICYGTPEELLLAEKRRKK